MLSRYFFFFLCFISLTVTAEDKTLLVLGDSLSAGYGISIQNSWVFLLQERLTRQGYRYQVINASISGDTTHGARARLDDLLKTVTPDITVVELGGNDGLRGIPLAEIYGNLDHIIRETGATGSKILLIPMQLPPNYGPAYTGKFMDIYTRLKDGHGVVLGKFILDGIADDANLMQGDGIHPVADAQLKMLDNVWAALQPMLEENR